MKIKCPGCDNVYNIPDERLPMGKKVAFPCPNCEYRIKLDLRSKPADDVFPPLTEIPRKEPEKEAGPLKKREKEHLSGEDLKKKILRTLSDLPSMPQVVIKAQEIISDPDSGIKQLAGVLESDQAIAANVLKMANSAYYGLSGRVSSIQHASVVLGYETLEELIIVAGTSMLLDKKLRGYGFDSGELWRHSLAVAFGSRTISSMRFPDLENSAFLAGLIHDAGKLMLDEYVFERKEAFGEFMEYGQETFLSAEKEIFGFDHSEIGFRICNHWHIPEALGVAIRYHHYPSRSNKDKLAYAVYMADSIVHMADSIARMGGVEKDIDVMMYQIDDRAMRFLGLKEEDISDIMDKITEYVKKITEEMG